MKLYFFYSPMKLLRFIPIFLLFCILIGGNITIYFLRELEWLKEIPDVILFLFAGGIEFFISIFIIHLYYEKPLKKLEYFIKKFLVWSLKEEKLDIKSANPHIKYIVLFFSKTLETLKNIKSEFIHGKEIKSEIDLAGEIQEKLLHKAIPDVPYLEIIGKSKPAAEIGWDSFDIIPQKDNYYIYVWDATGHGVGAWFIMVMVNALVSAFSKVTVKGNHILTLTNEIVKPNINADAIIIINI